MIGDDDVDAELDRAAHRLDAGDPAVDGDHQPHISFCENAFQYFQLQSVAVDQAMRHDVRCVGAEEAKNRLEEDDGGHTVDVVVAVDENRLVVPDRPLDPLAGFGDAVNAGGIVKIGDVRRDEAAVIVVSGDAASNQNVTEDRVNWKWISVVGRRREHPFVVDQAFSNTPILRNLSNRSAGSREGLTFCSSFSPRSRYGASRSAAIFASP